MGWAGIGEQECLQIDASQGWVPFENKNVTWRREGFSRVRFNSFGMQDREYPLAKPPGTLRIAIIGDSNVEALQVDRKENFCSLLESLLNKPEKDTHIEVMNFGVQAHNLSQTYIRLKALVLKFNPDIVILPIRPEASHILPPDLKGDFLSARPNFFVGADGKLIEDHTVRELWMKTRAAKRMQLTHWFRQNSRIWGVLSTGCESLCAWWQNGGLTGNLANPNELPGLQAGVANDRSQSTNRLDQEWTVTSEEGEKATRFLWPIADALILAMNKLCMENSCKLVVVRFPGVEGHMDPLESRLLEETVSTRAIPYLDLTENFHKRLRLNKQKLFYSTHLTPAGHQIVARQLHSFIVWQNIFESAK